MDTEALLNLLNEAYPDRLPLTMVSNYELGVLIGQQQVINKLKLLILKDEQITIKDK